MTTVPHKIKSLLGFAKKSGKLMCGESAVEFALKRNSAILVIFACDLPNKRRTHWEYRCRAKNIKYVTIGTKEEYGEILGISERSILAVLDPKMAAAITMHLDLIEMGQD